MSFGILELISLLLGLAGFGLHPDPKPPTVEAALAYAIPDPDVVVQLDAESIIPGNYKALLDLPNQAPIKSSPDVVAMVRKALGQVEGGRGLMKEASGIDFAADVTDATVFLQLTGHGDPNYLVTVHGKFSTANVDKIAASSKHKATPAGGGAWVELDDKTAVGVTRDHTLIAGMTPWVTDRMADSWKAPSHAAGSSLGYAAAAIDAKPVFAVVLTLSAAARQAAARGADGPQFVTDLINRHKAASFALYADGAGWSWTDSSKAGLESMAPMSDGAIDLMRAAQIAPRGIAKIALGAMESYRTDKHFADALAHKDDLLKIVGSYTGDGNFKVAVNKDVAKLTLTVRATGKTASEVVPLGMILPLAAIGFLLERSASMATPMPPMVTPAPPHHP